MAKDRKVTKTKTGILYTYKADTTKFFYPSDWERFYSALYTPKQKFSFLLFINTGLKVGEAIKIKVKDIDLENRIISVESTRFKKHRDVNFSTQFKTVLEEHIKENNLKPEDKLGILSTQTLHHARIDALKKSDIKNQNLLSLNNIIYTFEAWLRILGVDELKIRKQLVSLKYKNDEVDKNMFDKKEKKIIFSVIGDVLQKPMKEEEGQKIEFKSSLRWCYKTNSFVEELKFECLRTIVAFLNSDGGDLKIGIDDDGTVLGLEKDYSKLKNPTDDKFRLLINELISSYIGDVYHEFCRISFDERTYKKICIITVMRSDIPAYLYKNKKTLFYIRRDNRTIILDVEKAIRYAIRHFDSANL